MSGTARGLRALSLCSSLSPGPRGAPRFGKQSSVSTPQQTSTVPAGYVNGFLLLERERVRGFLFWKVLEAFSPTVSTVWNGAPPLCWKSFQVFCPTCLQFTEEEEKGGGKDTPRLVPLCPKFAVLEAFQEFCPKVFTAKLLNHRSHQLSVGKCSKALCPKVSTDHWSCQFSDGNLLSARKRPQFTAREVRRRRRGRRKKQWKKSWSFRWDVLACSK